MGLLGPYVPPNACWDDGGHVINSCQWSYQMVMQQHGQAAEGSGPGPERRHPVQSSFLTNLSAIPQFLSLPPRQNGLEKKVKKGLL